MSDLGRWRQSFEIDSLLLLSMVISCAVFWAVNVLAEMVWRLREGCWIAHSFWGALIPRSRHGLDLGCLGSEGFAWGLRFEIALAIHYRSQNALNLGWLFAHV